MKPNHPPASARKDERPQPPAWGQRGTSERGGHENRDSREESSRKAPPSSRAPAAAKRVQPPSQPPASARPDDLYEERMRTAVLAAELRESWRIEKEPARDEARESAQLEAALGEVHEAITGLLGERTLLLEKTEKQLLQVVRLVAERVIERSIQGDQELPLRLIREGLSALDQQSGVQIVLGPAFEVEGAVLMARLEQEGIRAEVTIDEHASPYACRLRTELGEVDESLETRLDALLLSLTPDGGEE